MLGPINENPVLGPLSPTGRARGPVSTLRPSRLLHGYSRNISHLAKESGDRLQHPPIC